MEKIYALAANPANKKLVAELEQCGARVILFPQITTEKAALGEESTRTVENLSDFDWLIFFDVFAADYFLEALEENGRDFYELDNARVCTLGEAVADRLRFAQVHADVVPNSVETESVIRSLAAYIGEREIGGNRFLLVKEEGAATAEIVGALNEKGAIVSELAIYRARIADAGGAANAKTKALLAGGGVDELVFTAPADFIALEALVPRQMLAQILREAKISATDEVTVQFLRERSIIASLFRRK